MAAMARDQIRAVLDRVLTWLRERQEAARLLLALEESSGVYVLDEEAADLDAAEAALQRGEIASDEEVRETFAALRRA